MASLKDLQDRLDSLKQRPSPLQKAVSAVGRRTPLLVLSQALSGAQQRETERALGSARSRTPGGRVTSRP
jgi:hypothetical protein